MSPNPTAPSEPRLRVNTPKDHENGKQPEQGRKLPPPAANTLPDAEDKPVAKAKAAPPVVPAAVTLRTPPHVASPPTGISTQLPGQPGAGPSVINKQLLSKLNKSLKEKQKIITLRDSKNPTLIQDVLSTSPSLRGINTSGITESGSVASASNDDTLEYDQGDGASMQSLGKDAEARNKAKSKSKRVAKQNSTRTDFFAAKLASAVDDIESSDSDETFVYETNPQEFENGNSGTTNTPTVNNLPQADDTRSVGGASHTEINHAPASIHLVNDNISVAGSIRNQPMESTANSPTADTRREDEHQNSFIPKAESVHSLQSSKYNLKNTFNTTPPTTTHGRLHTHPGILSSADSAAFPDPYMDHATRILRHPTRKSSLHSVMSDDRKELLRSPHSPYGMHSQLMSTSASYNLADQTPNLNEQYPDVMYSYGEDEVSGDDVSSHGDVNAICAEGQSPIYPNKESENQGISLKTRSNKPLTTSSKLRSTTSKLFDKKGAQPRRYSTIPDDIDIEDFDDELIYYDNNIRFPYNSQNPSSLNESTSLLNGHRLPHYRSLNLNVNNKKANPKTKRYLSLGYVPSGQLNKKSNPFPFPYQEQSGYYDFDEYDEDQIETGDELTKRFQRNKLSPSNTRFLLPRKVSQDDMNGGRLKLFKRFVYTLISILCILSIGFVLGFLLASTKDLSNLSILSIENALVSQDELVFSVVVEALNPGWFTVSIEDLELDIFAKSGYLEDAGAEASVETVLLGSVLNFESAIYFEGSFFNRQASQQVGEIKLIGPGKNFTGSAFGNTRRVTQQDVNGHTLLRKEPDDPKAPHTPPDNSEKWATISKHPFDLILRGVFKYNLPMTNNVKSVVVNKVGYVDPSLSS